MFNKIKLIIKNTLLKVHLKLKYKNAKVSINNSTFISTKAKIILGENAELVIGENSYISENCRLIVHANSKMIIGKGVYLSWNSLISSNSIVQIGDDTSIAHFVTIIDTNKNYDDIRKKIKEQSYSSKEIKIGRDSWIATGAVILAGSTIGIHSVVAANAVVNKQFEDYCVLGGVPAKVIKRLNV